MLAISPTAGCSPSSRRTPTATTCSISARSIPSNRASSPGRRRRVSVLVAGQQVIGFFARSKLKRLDVAGGAPVTLCEAAEPRGGSWSSRGVIIAAVHTGGALVRVAEGGGPATALLQLKPGGYRWPCFLPDGDHFVYFVFPGSIGAQGIHVASLESKESTRLVAADGGAIYAAPGHLRTGVAIGSLRSASTPAGGFSPATLFPSWRTSCGMVRRPPRRPRPPRTRAFSSVRLAARSPAACCGTTGRAASWVRPAWRAPTGSRPCRRTADRSRCPGWTRKPWPRASG